METRVSELASAVARGVRQCVLIGNRMSSEGTLNKLGASRLQVFAVAEERPPAEGCTFIETEFESETLAEALAKSNFDKEKPSLFVWVGAGYRTCESVLASFAFIASLPKGSGVVFDYVAERTSLGVFTQTALDTLASSFGTASGHFKYLIRPQAVRALLNGLGFLQIVDLAPEESMLGAHLVSAVV